MVATIWASWADLLCNSLSLCLWQKPLTWSILKGRRTTISQTEQRVKQHDHHTLASKTIILLNTYGSFILINTRHVKKDTKTHTKPRNSKRNLFNLDMPTALDLSKIMKPSPPMENRKLDARPSMMYCPLTRYGIKATWWQSTECGR